MQAKLRVRSAHLASFVFRRLAQVHMRVPLGNAKWNARVELLFGGIYGRRVHYPDELIAVALLFVKQGSRMIGIKVGTRFEAVPVICEVVLLLRPVRHKNFET